MEGNHIWKSLRPHHHASVDDKLNFLLAITTAIFEAVTMKLDLSDLTTEVERNSTVEGSAVTLIQALADAIAAAANDPAEVAALAARLKASSDALAAAVAANTPAGPTFK